MKHKIIEYPDDGFVIESVSNYYDHPLSGFAWYEGEHWWFENPYQTDTIFLFKLRKIEYYHALWQRFLFEKLVGTHWRYKDGKRTGHYSSKRRLLGSFGYKMFFFSKTFQVIVTGSWIARFYKKDQDARLELIRNTELKDWVFDDD